MDKKPVGVLDTTPVPVMEEEEEALVDKGEFLLVKYFVTEFFVFFFFIYFELLFEGHGIWLGYR